MDDMIQIEGAVENNLKHVNVSIPKNKLVVFAGVSGSGKSSLVFDTLAIESMRQLGEMLPPYVRNRMTHYEAPKVQTIRNLSPTVVIQQRQFEGDIRSTVGTMTNVSPMLRMLFSRCAHPHLTSSAAFSFNDPQGMCMECSGLGSTIQFDLHKLVDKERSLNEGAILFPGHQVGTYQWQLYANSGLLDSDKKLKDYSKKEWHDFLHGDGVVVEIHNTTGKVWNDYQLTYEGFLDRITRLYLKRGVNAKSKNHEKIIRNFTTECSCPRCHGARLNAKALQSTLNGMNIAQISALEIGDLIAWLTRICDPIGMPIAQKIIPVLNGIQNIGLGYLSLNRSSKSLSGGEVQRLRIVRQLGSSLNGLTYIFDEPSVGLHPQDVIGLITLLKNLRDKGNSVIVVEHNKQIIRCADYVFEMGPEAGENGGRVIFEGTPQQLGKADTPTGRSLSQHVLMPSPSKKAKEFITLTQACANNLKNISIHIPKQALTVVSGPAGAGKSSLICVELMKKYPQAVHIDQKPIGVTSRSNPATYVGIMNSIRKLFAEGNNIDAAMFSYNSEGACPMCQGRGVIKTEMAFMDPITVVCELCGGARYRKESLRYCYHDKNILDVMNMTVKKALTFFDVPKIRNKLQILQDVGLDYLTLGHPISELSGGECQRIKLAGHLKDKNGLFLFDEPTTGLHGEDVKKLIRLFRKLVQHGNTVVVIEHNMEMICQADWNIELGPGGGKNGGMLMFEGMFVDFLQCRKLATVQFLRQENHI